MKKTKLFLSISSLCFALSVLVFGVFAATQVDYSITGQIIYEVTDAYVEMDTVIYASQGAGSFSQTFDTCVALKSNLPSLSALGLVEYDVSDIVSDFSYNTLTTTESQSLCEFEDVALSGYCGYYFVISVRNLSSDVQVYVTATATSESSNVMVVTSGIVPAVSTGGSKIVVALMVEDATIPISTQDYTVTVKAGSIIESNFNFSQSGEGRMTISKKAGGTYSGALVIPETIGGVAVEAVGDFSGLNDITEIYVPETIEYFSEHCFNACPNLERLTVPFIGSEDTAEGAKILGYFFTDVDPNNANYYEVLFGSSMVKSYTRYLPVSLNTVTVTATEFLGFSNTRTTKYGAFRGTAIDTIIISSPNLISLGDIIFEDSEVKNVYLGPNTKNIRSRCFSGCSSLNKACIPSLVESISSDAFSATPFLSSLHRNGMAIATAYNDHSVRFLLGIDTDEIPSVISLDMLNGVVEIPYETFKNSDITEIYIPSSVKYIRSSAFNNCQDLEVVSIENGLEYIGAYAFENCTSLTSISIPTSVLEVEHEILSGCTSLVSIKVPFLGKKNYSSINQLRTEECDGDTSDGSMDYASMFAWYWGDSSGSGLVGVVGYNGTYYVPETLRYVEVFEGCLNIFDGAFNDDGLGCPITEIVIPSTIIEIGSCAFFGLDCLERFTCKAVTPPDTNGDAFESCGSLTTIYVPNISAYEDETPWSNFTLRQI